MISASCAFETVLRLASLSTLRVGFASDLANFSRHPVHRNTHFINRNPRVSRYYLSIRLLGQVSNVQ